MVMLQKSDEGIYRKDDYAYNKVIFATLKKPHFVCSIFGISSGYLRDKRKLFLCIKQTTDSMIH